MASQESFYDHALQYWESIPATVDGMLGGFSHISSTDIAGSNKFLRQFIKPPDGKTKVTHALDCGAGIGRITKRLLLPIFNQVDMVELNQEFLNQAPSFLGSQSSKVGNYFCCGLQNFTPEPARYDVIWCQWVLGHLTDSDLVAFFQRCQHGLAANGIIVVKENMCGSETADFDDKDSSYTRPRKEVLDIFHKAGLALLIEEKQRNFPKEIYDVRMFALQ